MCADWWEDIRDGHLLMGIQLPRTNASSLFLPQGLCTFCSLCQGFWNLCPNVNFSERSSLRCQFKGPSTRLSVICHVLYCYFLLQWKSKITEISYFLGNFGYFFFSACQSPLEHKPHESRDISILFASVSPGSCSVLTKYSIDNERMNGMDTLLSEK